MKALQKAAEPEQESLGVEELVQSLQQWHRVAGYSQRTLQADRERLQPFWRFLGTKDLVHGDRVELAAVTPALIADYQNYLFDYPHARTGQKITSSTQINYLTGVQTLFRFLHKTRKIAHDPTKVIKLPRIRVNLPSALLSVEEVRRLLLIPDTRTVLGFRDRCILEVFWTTGLRIHELVTLEVDSVRFEEGLLLIEQGKGNKQRLVPLGASALDWLRQYLRAVRPLLTREALPHRRWQPQARSPHLFLSQNGGPLDTSGINRKLKTYQRKAKIPKRLTGHVFRHTLATEMLKAGADLRHIQEMLGHQDLGTTQRYLRVVKEELKKVHQATHPREQMPVAPVIYRGSAAS